MVHELIVINGLPAAGKTTLATELGKLLGVPVISKDYLKESFADISGTSVSSGQLGALASQTLWRLAELIPDRVIVESWWFGPRDLGFVEEALSTLGNPPAVEVWCQIDPAVAMSRYISRNRHSIHPAGQESLSVWEPWIKDPQPLSVGKVLRVDTSKPTDVPALAEDIIRFFAKN